MTISSIVVRNKYAVEVLVFTFFWISGSPYIGCELFAAY